MKKIVKLCLPVALAALLLAGCLFGEGIAPATDPSSQPDASTSGQSSSAGASQPDGSQSSTGGTAPAVFTLTIPEGHTLARIGMVLEEKGICTTAVFIAATQTGAYADNALLAVQPTNANRCFALEGYLFPDTYEFYTTATPETIIRAMLANAEKRLSGEVMTAIQNSGYSVDEILTLASIIQKEAYGKESMALISSVLHNRLAIGMQLQCDVTIAYVEGAIKPFIDGDKDRYNEYYNTYKCAALPAGPICNPGLDAIWAALSPAASDYLYFVTDAEHNFYWAATWEEHQANVVAAGA